MMRLPEKHPTLRNILTLGLLLQPGREALRYKAKADSLPTAGRLVVPIKLDRDSSE